MNDSIKKVEQPSGKQIEQTGTGAKIKMPGLHQRVQAREAQVKLADPLTCSHRIGLMLDLSGSMNDYDDGKGNTTYGGMYHDSSRRGPEGIKPKVEYLKEAVSGFTTACDFVTTSIAIESFPENISRPLVCDGILVNITVQAAKAGGGTPLGDAMQRMLEIHPITRGIIISDGEAGGQSAPLDVTVDYKEAGIPIDCLHIGSSTEGERLLIEIAERTGGIFMKFTNVGNFAKAFQFLSPVHRERLANSSTAEILRLTGATEVRK
jgi:hypothetical protein